MGVLGVVTELAKSCSFRGHRKLVLYLGDTFIMTMLFWLLTGTIYCFGCFAFVRNIYSVAKVG